MLKIKLIAFLTLCCVALMCCLDESRSDGPVLEQMPKLDVPPGVDVQARGPIHEAFATPSTEGAEVASRAAQPPAQIDEMPPEEKPEGNVVWIGGYWGWDDDRQDYMWVSGCWRAKPASREWVPGYWREQDAGWSWVAGFWATTQANGNVSEVSYQPAPPAPPNVAPPGDPPAVDTFYIPGGYVWVDSRYAWRAGYWTRAYPGYIYIPGHYRWTPAGYIYVAGYWDQTLPHRGLLYAPVVVDFNVCGPRFVYCPGYAVTDVYVMDSLFVRPGYCHYYYGDYYGPRYVGLGFESGVLYGRGHYDPIIVYERRTNPGWYNAHVTLVVDRNAGRAPVPPRLLVNIDLARNRNMLASARMIAATRGERLVAMDNTARLRAKENAVALHVAASEQRHAMEAKAPPYRTGQPAGPFVKTGTLNGVRPLTEAGPAAKAAPKTNTPPHPEPHGKTAHPDDKKKS